MSENRLPHNHFDAHNLTELTAHLDKTQDFQTVSEVFRQLSDPNRVRIFWLLCHREECVINIASLVKMQTPAVSHHLRQLKTGSLIVSRREGKEVYYKVADTRAASLLHHAIEQMMTITCPKLGGKSL